MRTRWQEEQGAACGCKGHDDYCPCQNVPKTTWFVEQRLLWIAETLLVFGFINRHHLQRKFGVSTAQAAIDFKLFQERYPDAMTYNKSSKHYEASRPLTKENPHD